MAFSFVGSSLFMSIPMRQSIRSMIMGVAADNERELIYAEEAFIVDAQILLLRVMRECGVSRKTLAKRMNVDISCIRGFFSDQCDSVIQFLPSAMHALGKAIVINVKENSDGS
jgi:hypothetical protein